MTLKRSFFLGQAPVKKGRMIIHYHCDGKAIGLTTFPYTPEAYADWFRSMAKGVSRAASSKSAS
jgi:hypothetical protein